MLNGYGITECSLRVCCNRNKFQKKGSIGVPILHETIKILDPDENGEGEIFPDSAWLTEHAVADAQAYFDEAVFQVNSRMVAYKAVNLVKLRQEEFTKNTSRKIQRFCIDKRVD